MDEELKSLRIDRSARPAREGSRMFRWLALAGVILAVAAGATFLVAARNAPREVRIIRVHAPAASGGPETSIILNATGYIIAAHKIELASKVIGKVAWIGVEKGDRVRQGHVLVRLEDDEYRARALEAKGQLESLRARLAELEHGSRPEEIARANQDLQQARADLQNANVTLERTRDLASQGVLARQALDDAQARFDSQRARVASLERSFDLIRIGPRKEQIEAARAQVLQAEGTLAYAQSQLDNTVIRAPVAGTILERNVEKGEFVTTGFVGDKGAKGYVVSIADLNDLQVELDINQGDFAKLGSRQPATVTTDAYPDLKYEGFIQEISPEANRQKATVQVKVKVRNPDERLRPDMNASVAFYSRADRASGDKIISHTVVPASALRDGWVFIVVDGKAVARKVRTGGRTSDGVQIAEGLIGGEDLIADPPADLKNGQKVRPKQG